MGHAESRLLLAWLALVPSASLLVQGPATTSSATYEGMRGVQVTRASDSQSLELTSMWGEQDRAALFFLRHFG